MDFVGTSSGGGSLGSENGPPIFIESNRTSAYDDLRSVFIYIFIVAIFLSFFLILPGIRNEKFPTFLCITTSLIVTSIILISLFGTSWHAGQAQISAPYKAFSKDRIQGELSIRIGLRSVNITLRAHKYYELQAAQKPVIIRKPPPVTVAVAIPQSQPSRSSISSSSSISSQQVATPTSSNSQAARASKPLNRTRKLQAQQTSGRVQFITTTTTTTTSSTTTTSPSNLAEELLVDRTSDEASVDTELEIDEVFPPPPESSSTNIERPESKPAAGEPVSVRPVRSPSLSQVSDNNLRIEREDFDESGDGSFLNGFTVERLNVDINYNERFYWIEPNQMRQEHHNALERGLPYPILTVVEYLSQDEAGFSWSRQYRLAGYYTHILLWLSFCISLLMFFLHCATPKYGIYTMQILGCLMLFTNFTYSTLVPKGDQKLVIPFEGQQLTLKFGWNYWLMFIGGCLSLIVGTLIVIIDSLFPNYIFTTVLDVDFDAPNKYYKMSGNSRSQLINDKESPPETPKGVSNSPARRLIKPPFFVEPNDDEYKKQQGKISASKSSLENEDRSTAAPQHQQVVTATRTTQANNMLVSPFNVGQSSTNQSKKQSSGPFSTSQQEVDQPTSDSEMVKRAKLVERNSSVVEMMMPGMKHPAIEPTASESSEAPSDSKITLLSSTPQLKQQSQLTAATSYGKLSKNHRQQGKSVNLKSTDQQASSYLQSQSKVYTAGLTNSTSSQVRL